MQPSWDRSLLSQMWDSQELGSGFRDPSTGQSKASHLQNSWMFPFSTPPPPTPPSQLEALAPPQPLNPEILPSVKISPCMFLGANILPAYTALQALS